MRTRSVHFGPGFAQQFVQWQAVMIGGDVHEPHIARSGVIAFGSRFHQDRRQRQGLVVEDTGQFQRRASGLRFGIRVRAVCEQQFEKGFAPAQDREVQGIEGIVGDGPGDVAFVFPAG